MKIHRHFRIISTSNFDKISQISPAFLNRFQVITLEDQFSFKNIEGIKNLISILANKYQYEYYENCKKVKKSSQKKVKKKRLDEEKKEVNKEIKKEIELNKEELDFCYLK